MLKNLKFHIKPGQNIILGHKAGGGERLSVSMATVLKVYGHSILIAEEDSGNGLAEIMTCKDSAESGAYWYEHQGMDSDSGEVAGMYTEDGLPIRLSCFIED